MSGYERHPRHHPRPHGAGGVWSVAAFSAFVFCLSVLGAKFLAGLAENERRALTEGLPQPGLAKPGPESGRLPSAFRAGVDHIVTGTIPKASRVSPCGDEKGNAKPGG
jgi:hypothetical protein